MRAFALLFITLVGQALARSVSFSSWKGSLFLLPWALAILHFFRNTVSDQSMMDIECDLPSLVTGHLFRPSCRTASPASKEVCFSVVSVIDSDEKKTGMSFNFEIYVYRPRSFFKCSMGPEK